MQPRKTQIIYISRDAISVGRPATTRRKSLPALIPRRDLRCKINSSCRTRPRSGSRARRTLSSRREKTSHAQRSLRCNFAGRPFPRVYHVVKGTSCRSHDEGRSRWLISRQCRGVACPTRRTDSGTPSYPRASLPRDVIPIATITFNRVEHAIIVIKLIYELSP